MKKLILYNLLIILSVIYFGCDKPAPTELVSDENQDEFEIEVLTKDLNDEFYSNGFDTTGVPESLNEYTNVIMVGGIKITKENQTQEGAYARAIFFDKTKPIFSPAGRLIGYRTRTPGDVKFNNKFAHKILFKKHFRNHGQLSDTTLGFQYLLLNGRGNNDDFNFQYNSSINFKFNPTGSHNTEFDIPTPPEVTGTVKLEGNRLQRNLRLRLSWTKAQMQSIDIIIGVKERNRNLSFPLYKLKTKDDGELIIPARLLNNIPVDRFNKLIISFVRKFQFNNNEGNNQLHIRSHSIHTLEVNFN